MHIKCSIKVLGCENFTIPGASVVATENTAIITCKVTRYTCAAITLKTINDCFREQH